MKQSMSRVEKLINNIRLTEEIERIWMEEVFSREKDIVKHT